MGGLLRIGQFQRRSLYWHLGRLGCCIISGCGTWGALRILYIPSRYSLLPKDFRLALLAVRIDHVQRAFVLVELYVIVNDKSASMAPVSDGLNYPFMNHSIVRNEAVLRPCIASASFSDKSTDDTIIP
jgi:hypothetical protein